MLSASRSVFPYSMVPMTRLDPVSKKQVVMHFQNEEFYVQRPLVIARSEPAPRVCVAMPLLL